MLGALRANKQISHIFRDMSEMVKEGAPKFIDGTFLLESSHYNKYIFNWLVIVNHIFPLNNLWFFMLRTGLLREGEIDNYY